jgi:hypothetical protein
MKIYLVVVNTVEGGYVKSVSLSKEESQKEKELVENSEKGNFHFNGVNVQEMEFPLRFQLDNGGVRELNEKNLLYVLVNTWFSGSHNTSGFVDKVKIF